MIKRNITINFCGRLYAIDEDAYELLKHYTETIRRYYSKEEGGEEIADDIEQRIAELLDEEKNKGMVAINIDMTKSIISRIGNLEDIAPEANTNARNASHDEPNSDWSQKTASEKLRDGANTIASGVADGAKNAWDTMKSNKRFFLDKQNAVLAGVLAGCSQYFGGSVIAWRLIFLCLVFIPMPLLDWTGIGGILAFLYIALAIIAPSAVKPEEVLSMQGKDVTPQNLAEEVSRQSTAKPTNGFANVISLLLKIILAFVCFGLTVGLIAALTAGAIVLTEPLTWLANWLPVCDPQPEMLEAARVPLYIAAGAMAGILLILTYCSMHAIASSFGKTPSMGFGQRMLWFVAFIVCVVTMFASGIRAVTAASGHVGFYNNIHIEVTDDQDSLEVNDVDSIGLNDVDSLEVE